jgi:hypothetical protein
LELPSHTIRYHSRPNTTSVTSKRCLSFRLITYNCLFDIMDLKYDYTTSFIHTCYYWYWFVWRSNESLVYLNIIHTTISLHVQFTYGCVVFPPQMYISCLHWYILLKTLRYFAWLAVSSSNTRFEKQSLEIDHFIVIRMLRWFESIIGLYYS